MADLEVVKSESKESFAQKVFRHRAGIVIRWVLAIAVVVGIVFWLKYQADTKVYTGYEILTKSLRSDADNSKYMVYNHHILKYSQDGAEAFDGTDSTIWNVTYEMQDPKVATCGDYVAMGDEGATEIIVMDPTGKQTSIRTKLPILSFCVARQGVVAAVLQDGSSSRINLYDREGNLLAGLKSTMGKSGYPIDLSLSPNGTILAVSYVRMVKNEIRSSVAFYNFSDVGQNEIDHYVSGYDYDGTIIPRIRFLTDSAAVAIGDDRIVFYTGSQKPELKTEIPFNKEIQSVFYGDDGTVALVFRSERGGSYYRIHLYDTDGEVLQEQEFTLDYTDIQISNGLIIIYNDLLCQIFNRSGLSRFEGVFEDPVLLMAPTDSVSKYILINRNMTQRIQLD
ncbi:MAG: DUF5711 family protein [Lachnospiraceae bacterium]|nr:DUF5711 family protein [Lachnospiraceae bacterium]